MAPSGIQHPMHAMVAPIGPPPPPIQMAPMDGTQPDMPSNGPVVARMTPVQQYENDLGNRLMADYGKDANPYGSPTNHPGKLGKFLHGLSVATGGPNRRFAEEQQFGNTLENIEKERALENEQGAQAENLRSEVTERGKQKLSPLQTSEGIENYNPETGAISPLGGAEGAVMPYQKPGPQQHVVLQGPDGRPMLGFVDPQTGVTRDAQGAPIENPIPFEKPTAPQHITVMKGGQPHVMGADADGNFTRDLGVAPPNYAMIAPELKTFQTKDENGQNVTKTLSGKTLGVLPDTSTQRNMAEMAATVQPQMESVINEVGQLANSVGPAVGRWNELMVNKGGADYPQFAGLDTDLDLLASAIVRTHFGARGGQEYREELKKMFGAAQSPQDLVNRIEHAEGWIEGYAASGGAKTPVGHAYQGGTGTAQPIVQMNKKTGAYRYSTDGGQTWQNGQPPSR
ncbi:MAG TPA: hypothetical protein VF730_05060 [Terracidiphilus sp.]